MTEINKKRKKEIQKNEEKNTNIEKKQKIKNIENNDIKDNDIKNKIKNENLNIKVFYFLYRF